ncbi:aldehyde dehydrogenase family protein [Amycolatopsis sp. K13G38]|uniref:Aldehyde dehydrogenase family protein n=2 Tax=Amycolatopsis acididurans TaxID=2724524 RepID=A0ABX1JE54_9PSEU|nr:aldehyde dehydrogenase family protein [Amycolatopsis acididurans]
MKPLADVLGARMGSLRVGPASREDTELGPLVSPQAVAKVTELVNDAVNRGASTATVGTRRSGVGYYYPPTVLMDVPRDADIVAEEVFGPVASLIPFDDDAEAIALANNTEYGLAAYVYGGDLRRAMRVAEALEAHRASRPSRIPQRGRANSVPVCPQAPRGRQRAAPAPQIDSTSAVASTPASIADLGRRNLASASSSRFRAERRGSRSWYLLAIPIRSVMCQSSRYLPTVC